MSPDNLISNFTIRVEVPVNFPAQKAALSVNAAGTSSFVIIYFSYLSLGDVQLIADEVSPLSLSLPVPLSPTSATAKLFLPANVLVIELTASCVKKKNNNNNQYWHIHVVMKMKRKTLPNHNHHHKLTFRSAINRHGQLMWTSRRRRRSLCLLQTRLILQLLSTPSQSPPSMVLSTSRSIQNVNLKLLEHQPLFHQLCLPMETQRTRNYQPHKTTLRRRPIRSSTTTWRTFLRTLLQHFRCLLQLKQKQRKLDEMMHVHVVRLSLSFPHTILPLLFNRVFLREW